MGDGGGRAVSGILRQHTVRNSGQRIYGRCFHRVRELGRSLFLGFLKNKARHDLIFLRVINALFLHDFLLWDFRLSLCELFLGFLYLFNGFLKLRCI